MLTQCDVWQRIQAAILHVERCVRLLLEAAEGGRAPFYHHRLAATISPCL